MSAIWSVRTCRIRNGYVQTQSVYSRFMFEHDICRYKKRNKKQNVSARRRDNQLHYARKRMTNDKKKKKNNRLRWLR